MFTRLVSQWKINVIHRKAPFLLSLVHHEGYFSWLKALRIQQTVGGPRAAATVCPRPSPPPWAPKRLPPLSRRQRSSSFPRPTRSHAHHCSRLTRQYGGEQRGLVNLTFDLWPFDLESDVRVTCDVGYLCVNLVLLGLSVLDLGPMYATHRRQTDI